MQTDIKNALEALQGKTIETSKRGTQTIGAKKKKKMMMMDTFTSVTLIVGDNFIRRHRTENDASMMRVKQQTSC